MKRPKTEYIHFKLWRKKMDKIDYCIRFCQNCNLYLIPYKLRHKFKKLDDASYVKTKFNKWGTRDDKVLAKFQKEFNQYYVEDIEKYILNVKVKDLTGKKLKK